MSFWKPRYNKFGNTKTSIGNKKFDSKAEAQEYLDLTLLERAKKIKYLQTQVRIPLQKKGSGITYIADFVYFDCELKEWVVLDTKGFITDAFRIKRAWLLDRYCGYIFITNFKAKNKRDIDYPSKYADDDLSKVFVEKFVDKE